MKQHYVSTVQIPCVVTAIQSFYFRCNRYVGAISEAAPVNTVVQGEDGNPLVIQATDMDRNHNALLVFQILDETARMFFTVDSGTGSIR